MTERTPAQEAAFLHGYRDRTAGVGDFARRGYSFEDGSRQAYMEGRTVAALEMDRERRRGAA